MGRVPVPPCVPGYSTNNKLQFEARLATHNGRDIHRQLCGYFFMDDGSLTIYEFRQFGKKLSALPLIHRGLYCVCSGRKKGHPYQIRDIKKEAILQFWSRDHPNLPVSLHNKTILYLRVTQVNEETKKELVCKYYPREQHKRLESVMMSPVTVSGVRDAHMLLTMQGMLCHLLTGRASQVLVDLGRYLQSVAKDDVITFNQLEQALRNYHISLTTEDMSSFWKLLQNSPIWNESLDGLHLDSILQVLTGAMSEDCYNLVRQIFIKLDSSKSGVASFDQILKIFRGSDTNVWQNMHSILIQKSVDGVSYADFEHFHIGVRLELASNSKFINELKSSWCL